MRRAPSSLLFALPFAAGAAIAQPGGMPPDYGPQPRLPPPLHSLLPSVKIAPAKGWPEGVEPTPAKGFVVNAYAVGLDHPRWLYVLPNGDVLVAQTDAPEKPGDAKGVRGWVYQKVMKKAGSGRSASANRITLLRDKNGDGVAEERHSFVEGVNSPFGMVLAGRNLYVAATDALLRFPYRDGQTGVGREQSQTLAELPGGALNHHWTKNVVASRDGRKLYVAVGSNSNVAENGLDAEADRADILEIDARTGAKRVYASGLRNPVGMAWQPDSGALWVVVNERDELGDELPPDYLTSVKEGGFYGWPFSYFGNHVDDRVKPQNPELVAKAIVPDYALGAHTASLGLAFYDAKLFPQRYRGGAFVGQHGSWNRKQLAGYKVIFVPFRDGRPDGPPEDVLGGFVDRRGNARGRPAGVAVDSRGALLVADDVGNTVWRVAPAR